MNEKSENTRAREGVDRCSCGSKYWEGDRCVDCGAELVELSPTELVAGDVIVTDFFEREEVVSVEDPGDGALVRVEVLRTVLGHGPRPAFFFSGRDSKHEVCRTTCSVADVIRALSPESPSLLEGPEFESIVEAVVAEERPRLACAS
jgi:hypothetical protein